MARVLIIDDDPLITGLLREHLSNEGYAVDTVHLAEDGFEKALKSPPQLIFLDVMLPDATGFQMIGRFRQNPITQSIPIIMMTGSAKYPNQIQIGKDMGANEYILKPFDVIDVGVKVHRLIGVKEEAAVDRILPPEPLSPIHTNGNGTHAETLVDEPHARVDFSPPAPEPNEAEEPFSEPRLDDLPAPVEEKETFDNPEAEQPHASELPMVQERSPTPAPRSSNRLLTGLMFLSHLAIAAAAENSYGMLQGLSYVAGGWILVLGLVVVTCSLLKITVEGNEAIGLLGWASIPIVLRSGGGLLGWIVNPGRLPASLFWLRPLDIFEMVSAVILGLSLRKLRGGSLKKSFWATVLIALVWSLTARGYFRLF